MLVTCIECGASVSDTSKLCPRCNKDIKGALCLYCGQRCAYSKSVISGHQPLYHTDCIDSYKRDFMWVRDATVTCPDCKDTWTVGRETIEGWLLGADVFGVGLTSGGWWNCSNCGWQGFDHVAAPMRAIGFCKVCLLPVYKGRCYCKSSGQRAGRNLVHHPRCTARVLDDDATYFKRRGEWHEGYSYYDANGRFERYVQVLFKDGQYTVERESTSEPQVSESPKQPLKADSSGGCLSLIVLLVVPLGAVVGRLYL